MLQKQLYKLKTNQLCCNILFVVSVTKFFTEVSSDVLRFLAFPIVGIDFVEIVIHYVTNLQQYIGGYPWAFKKVIDVLSRVIQLSCKPSFRPLLSFKFGFDEMSDMWRFVCGHGVGFQAQKKRGIVSCLKSRATTPYAPNKYSTP